MAIEFTQDKPRQWGWLRRLLIVTVTLLVFAIAYLLFMTITDGLPPGAVAPDFIGHPLQNAEENSGQSIAQNKAVRLSDYRGQPVMLVFWSPDCEICREELPAIQSIADDPQNQAVLLTVISYVPNAEVVAFAAAQGLTFPLISDEAGEISQRYNVHGIPFTFLINADGVIDKTIVGGGDQDTLSSKFLAWVSTCDVKEQCS